MGPQPHSFTYIFHSSSNDYNKTDSLYLREVRQNKSEFLSKENNSNLDTKDSRLKGWLKSVLSNFVKGNVQKKRQSKKAPLSPHNESNNSIYKCEDFKNAE